MKSLPSRCGALGLALVAGTAIAAPLQSAYPVDGPDDTAAVAAAPFAGLTLTADTFEDRVELRDHAERLLRSISRSEIHALLPWMSLDGGPDGPGTVAFSASGRLAFILVHDDAPSPDAQGSDAVLRYDVGTNTLALCARLDAFDRGDIAPHLAMAHHKALLYVGTASGGGGVRVYLANATSTSGTLLTTWSLPSGAPIRGIAIDRDAGTCFVCTDSAVYRAVIPASVATPPTWTQIVGSQTDLRAIAWGDHYGAAANRGLYLLAGASTVSFVPYASAYASSLVTPTLYLTLASPAADLAQTADGSLLVATDEDALRVRDSSDTRLSYSAWLDDEFDQVVRFAKGLVSPDSEPAGWVIDADTDPATPRFHPATPDAAGWAVLLLLASDHLRDDPQAQPLIRTILTRYAGLSVDSIKPSRSADGVYRHWIDPLTGQTKPGWDPEYATLSTMKIVAGAGRAMERYPDDPQIVRAASRIIFLTKNHDAYLQAGTEALAFKALQAGGADTGSFARPFHEGIIFAEQCAALGSSYSRSSYTQWLNRSRWPSATYLPGMPITSTGGFEAAFISLYPALLTPDYRASLAWREQVSNIRWSNAAWTDDSAPRFFTVFSAGTTRSDWGGYRADSLSTHPGNVTTLTSLLAFSAFGDESTALGGYHAYRKGARQTFRTGASFLYRRSDVDRSYLPNSAGLPDVALGALGIAEILSPGVIDAVLARPTPTTEQCPLDLNADGVVDIEDLYLHAKSPTDLSGDMLVSSRDAACLRAWCRRHETPAR